MFDEKTTERQWQAWVIHNAMYNKWSHYHAPDNKPDGLTGKVQMIVAGFPDLVLVKGNRLVFAELKREKGKVTEAQKVWLKRLEATGAECYIWRPSQWEEVLAILEK
jgi:hypothetical protein